MRHCCEATAICPTSLEVRPCMRSGRRVTAPFRPGHAYCGTLSSLAAPLHHSLGSVSSVTASSTDRPRDPIAWHSGLGYQKSRVCCRPSREALCKRTSRNPALVQAISRVIPRDRLRIQRAAEHSDACALTQRRQGCTPGLFCRKPCRSSVYPIGARSQQRCSQLERLVI